MGSEMCIRDRTFCQEYGIIDDYDGQLVMSLFQNLKERECCEEE